MSPQHKDFELDVHVFMSKRLFLIVTGFTWIWTIASFFYTTYVYSSDKNPVIDWFVAIPQYFANVGGGVGVGKQFVFLFSGIILTIVSTLIMLVIFQIGKGKKGKRNK